MHWTLAGLIAGVVAYVADYVMWGRVFTKGMDQYGTLEGAQERMGGMLAKSAGLAIGWGTLLAFVYRQIMNSLWIPPGALAGMEFATSIWLVTIAFASIGAGVWYDKARRLLHAQLWSWLVRLNAAGLALGILIKA